jgi:hypothetical protein
VSKHFEIKGHDEIIKKFRRYPKHFLDAAAVGEFNAGQVIMKLSKSWAPFEHGDLEKSAFVNLPRITAMSVLVEIGYYGIQYLERQHEDTSYQHPGKYSKTKNRGRAAQGQSKFLESAVQELEAQSRQIVANAINYFIRTGRLPAMKGNIKGKS